MKKMQGGKPSILVKTNQKYEKVLFTPNSFLKNGKMCKR